MAENPSPPYCRVTGKFADSLTESQASQSYVLLYPDATGATAGTAYARSVRAKIGTDGALSHMGNDYADILSPGSGVTPSGSWTYGAYIHIPDRDDVSFHFAPAQGTVVDLSTTTPVPRNSGAWFGGGGAVGPGGEIDLSAYLTSADAAARYTTKASFDAAKTFPSLISLMSYSAPAELPTAVRTLGHEFPSDGAQMDFTLETWTPSGTYGNIGVRIGSRWAILRNLRTAPVTSPDVKNVNAMLKRAQTFVDAGTEIEWNASVRTPLHANGPTRTPSGKWGLTCSTFACMVLSGLTYGTSTYTSASNTFADPLVSFGKFVTTDLWQAHRLARWAFANGDAWCPVASDWQAGDVLFWGKQNPEGANTTGRYFMNVYHTGIYAGNGMVYQSKSASDPQGVMHESITTLPIGEVVLAWRPRYSTTPSVAAQALVLGASDPVPDGTESGTLIIRTA